MADHIPFVTGEDAGKLVKKAYADSGIARVPLDRASRFASLLPHPVKVWIDPCVDGMGDLDSRRSQDDRRNPWFEFMSSVQHFERIASPAFQTHPVPGEVYAFVKVLMDKCIPHKPAWITVPQMPLAKGSERNKINRTLAAATGRWKGNSGYSGRLILPLLFTHQDEIKGKTVRRPRVQQAERCYHDAHADGFWVVDKSLADDSGSPSLRNKRFAYVIELHQELNERIPSKIRIGGPYWGLNLVLWARGLVDYPAIGIGAGYQYFMAGGHAKQPVAKLALPALRRRVDVGPKLREWLDAAIARLGPSHPAHAEFTEIRKNYSGLSEPDRAREQVARFYKKWFDAIALAPKAGRSMALFQDLSVAYALGKSLPELEGEGAARKPEAVVEPLMLSCL